VGLRRHGFSHERIATLKRAYELLFQSGHRRTEAIKRAKEEFKDSDDVLAVLTFMEGTKRGVCKSVGRGHEDEE
jgi:UDP-N-acetylglucosamine acyltransferase